MLLILLVYPCQQTRTRQFRAHTCKEGSITNCMTPLSSVNTGVVICIFVLLALPPKMYFASALNALSPLPAGLPSSFAPELEASIWVSATSTLSYLHKAQSTEAGSPCPPQSSIGHLGLRVRGQPQALSGLAKTLRKAWLLSPHLQQTLSLPSTVTNIQRMCIRNCLMIDTLHVNGLGSSHWVVYLLISKSLYFLRVL